MAVLTDNPHILSAYPMHEIVDGDLKIVMVVETDLDLDVTGAGADPEAYKSVMGSIKDFLDSKLMKPRIQIRGKNAWRS